MPAGGFVINIIINSTTVARSGGRMPGRVSPDREKAVMLLFEEIEQILDELDQAESRLEKIRIDGVESVDAGQCRELALEIKKLVVRVVNNVEACGGAAEKLGGALVLMDLTEVLRRYGEIFEVEGLDASLKKLEKA